MRLGGIGIIEAIQRLILIFADKTTDRTTLDELYLMAGDRDRWQEAHQLFQRIRTKSLNLAGRNDAKLAAQYCFEEACAKTLYNLPRNAAPFDADSPYWIIPNALVTAQLLGMHPSEIIAAVVLNQKDW